jgi:hypothetical protein
VENVNVRVSLTTYLDKLTASCLHLFHQFSISEMFWQEMVQTCDRPTTQSLLTKQIGKTPNVVLASVLQGNEICLLVYLTLSTALIEEHQMTQPLLTTQIVATAYVNVLLQHLPGDNEETHGKHYTKWLKRNIYHRVSTMYSQTV